MQLMMWQQLPQVRQPLALLLQLLSGWQWRW
jgi:hypothetical protein